MYVCVCQIYILHNKDPCKELEDNKYSYMGGGRANEVSFGGIIAVRRSKEPWISEHAHLVYTIGPINDNKDFEER